MEITIKRGLDLRIAGGIADNAAVSISSSDVAVFPEDFTGFTPKADIKAGDSVSVGSPLLHDKFFPELKLTSPVSGIVTEVVRGERRRIVCVKVASDGKNTPVIFALPRRDEAGHLLELLSLSGLLALVRRRPFDIVARPDDNVRDIFVTGFDSAPLAPLPAYGEDDVRFMGVAVKALRLLANEHIYIARRPNQQLPDIPGAVMIDVTGPHPAGNTSVQIAAVSPVNKGETVWTMSADTLVRIGRLLSTGRVDWSTRVALTGSMVASPVMVDTVAGASVAEIIEGRLSDDPHSRRIISGNVLTGVKIASDGYLRFPYTHITVIPEGDDVDEFMGWASLSPSKMSINPSFPGHFLHRMFKPDARVLGGRRAMIMSGLIDRVLPMDIMGEFLIKAINARDIDRMEQLGIYEVAPEDFALAECIDSSKVPYQQIVRDGLEYLRNELG